MRGPADTEPPCAGLICPGPPCIGPACAGPNGTGPDGAGPAWVGPAGTDSHGGASMRPPTGPPGIAAGEPSGPGGCVGIGAPAGAPSNQAPLGSVCQGCAPGGGAPWYGVDW